jgi:sec-independent protein translocase protein TatA
MNVFGIGLPEMAIIFVVALLIFGPKKLPEIGRTFGKTLRSFQDASREFQEEFEKEAKAVEKIATQAMEATLETKPADKPKIEAAKVEEVSPEVPEEAERNASAQVPEPTNAQVDA